MTSSTRRALFAAGLSSAMLPALAHAQTPEDFYKGRNITLQVGYAPGGGYDVYARFLARSYGQHIPASRTSSFRMCQAPEASSSPTRCIIPRRATDR